MTNLRRKPVVLCILDGWGWREEREANAIALAETPNWDRMMDSQPHALIQASAAEVGLPLGQMGNSEVGHMNIGAGRIVMQDLPRIDAAIAGGDLSRNPGLTSFIEALRASGGACHLLGLLSPGGVHSHQDHVVALARAVAAADIPINIHAVLDGRDTPPRSARGYLRSVASELAHLDRVTIATVGGRYFAMDRDNRWERVAQAYATLVDGHGYKFNSADRAVAASYADDVGDEFMVPVSIDSYRGMADGDGLLMANFRADRARQILRALLDPEFEEFTRPRTVSFAAARGMVEYSTELNELVEPLFPPIPLRHTLGEVIAANGLRQLRIAETEKYAHVTFFLNGGREAPFAGEERVLIPSPGVATYDLKPEMSAVEVADAAVRGISGAAFDFIVVNFANPDMVGHTGKLDATMQAVQTVDQCLGRIDQAVSVADGVLLITADHGNAEQMAEDAGGQSHTAHTINPVPLLLSGGPPGATLENGRLADIAPTVLTLLGIERPNDMSGRSLLGASVMGTKRRAVG